VVGICALPASVLFGLLWNAFGAATAFAASAALAVSAALLLLFLADPAVGATNPNTPD
jgi:arginine/ornithine N-succinyltransferase beta subunit